MDRFVPVSLDQLSEMLKIEGLPSQSVMASAIGVDQSLVSRARAGRLRRVTRPVEALAEYVQTRIDEMRVEAATEPNSLDVGRQAESSVRRYLSDGFDPRLLLEQVAVLRRAQSRTARKGAGRPLKPGPGGVRRDDADGHGRGG